MKRIRTSRIAEIRGEKASFWCFSPFLGLCYFRTLMLIFEHLALFT
jgi:hypothetical protein